MCCYATKPSCIITVEFYLLCVIIFNLKTLRDNSSNLFLRKQEAFKEIYLFQPFFVLFKETMFAYFLENFFCEEFQLCFLNFFFFKSHFCYLHFDHDSLKFQAEISSYSFLEKINSVDMFCFERTIKLRK